MNCECGFKLSAKAITCSNCDEMFNEELETYDQEIKWQEITKMINTTIENLTKAKKSKDERLVQAVLVNLNSVLPSYIEALDNE